MVLNKRHHRKEQRHEKERRILEITGSGEMRFGGSYLVRGAVNIGALAERAGMVL